MMRHQVGEVAPELDHLRADAACGGATSSRKYSAGIGLATVRPTGSVALRDS
jgi:hypothetical protein